MASLIRVFATPHPTGGSGPVATIENGPDSGPFSGLGAISTAGWAPGTYAISITATLTGKSESLQSAPVSEPVNALVSLYGTPVTAGATDAGLTTLTTGTVTVPAGGARVFVCTAGVGGAVLTPPTISSTLGAAAWTRIDAASSDPTIAATDWGKRTLDWFYADIPGAASGTITVTFPAAAFDRFAAVYVVQGSTQINGATRNAWSGGAAAELSRAVTTTAAGAIVLVGVANMDSGLAPAARAGTTLDGQLLAGGNFNSYAAGHAAAAGAGSLTVGSSTTTATGLVGALEVA